MAQTYAEWLESPSPLNLIEVGGFYVYSLAWSLHEIDGHLALSVLADDDPSATVVLKLTPTLEAEARGFLPFSKATNQPLHDWIRNARLDDCEVLGASTNQLHEAVTEMGNVQED